MSIVTSNFADEKKVYGQFHLLVCCEPIIACTDLLSIAVFARIRGTFCEIGDQL